MAAPAPAQQVIKCGLVRLPRRKGAGSARAPFDHGGAPRTRVTHDDDSSVTVLERVEAAVVETVLGGVEAVGRGEDVGVRKVLEAGHTARD